MVAAENAPHDSDEPKAGALSFADGSRIRLGRLSLRCARLRGPLWRFAHWLADDVFGPARAADRDRVRLRIGPDGSLDLLGSAGREQVEVPEGLGRLGSLLASVSIVVLELDSRLESNQVTDVLALIWAARRRLRRRVDPAGRSLAARLHSEAGVQFACAQVRIADGKLEVTYSYCVTCFSRVVRWFERSRTRFADHRALFHAGPRYDLLAAAVALLPVLAYVVWGPCWEFVTVTLLVAAAEFALVYFFFMTVGSVEYDNEEKTHRLEVAYSRLDRYARRIGDDLKRARTVQRRMLPDPARMPLGRHLQWASSFVPADQVGGDYYDAMMIGPGRVAIAFGDVSGHDMAAAFVTAILKTTFQAWRDEGGTLSEFAARLNRRLCGLLPDDSFAAVFLAVYDAGREELRYVNGGHNPEPWLVGPDSDRPPRSLSDGRALLLGVEDPIDIRIARTRLDPGDTVVFVTDGVTEAADIDGQFYGAAKLAKLLSERRKASVEELVRHIVDDVRDFGAGADQIDDQTILAVRVRSDL